jgi:hypothetical protein
LNDSTEPLFTGSASSFFFTVAAQYKYNQKDNKKKKNLRQDSAEDSNVEFLFRHFYWNIKYLLNFAATVKKKDDAEPVKSGSVESFK